MKTLKRKIGRRAVRKWMGYLIAAYLLASWGVNGVAGPLHYIRCAQMQMGAQEGVPIKELELLERPDGMAVSLPEGYLEQGLAYLSFQAVETKDYTFELRILGNSVDGDAKEAGIKVRKGWNTVSLEDLAGGKQWKEIVVPTDVVEEEQLVLKDVGLSKWRKVDIGRMVYVFAAFLFLAVFWECVWWVKERYAQ